LTQVYRMGLAHMLYHAGDYQQALRVYSGVYRDCGRILGRLNHLTITAGFATACLHWIEDQKAEAE
jgi:hypothetical protein